MPKWEYCNIFKRIRNVPKGEKPWHISGSIEKDFLQEMGDAGWELVSVFQTNDYYDWIFYYFKREVIPTNI